MTERNAYLVMCIENYEYIIISNTKALLSFTMPVFLFIGLKPETIKQESVVRLFSTVVRITLIKQQSTRVLFTLEFPAIVVS